jgi:hypothetical protein
MPRPRQRPPPQEDGEASAARAADLLAQLAAAQQALQDAREGGDSALAAARRQHAEEAAGLRGKLEQAAGARWAGPALGKSWAETGPGWAGVVGPVQRQWVGAGLGAVPVQRTGSAV